MEVLREYWWSRRNNRALEFNNVRLPEEKGWERPTLEIALIGDRALHREFFHLRIQKSFVR